MRTALFMPTHRRPIGYVFQEASLFPHLSVRRNLEFGLKRTPVAERRVRIGTDHRPAGHRPFARPPTGTALRRRAPAGGHRPRPGRQSAPAADGRTAGGAGSGAQGRNPALSGTATRRTGDSGALRQPLARRGGAAGRPCGVPGSRSGARRGAAERNPHPAGFAAGSPGRGGGRARRPRGRPRRGLSLDRGEHSGRTAGGVPQRAPCRRADPGAHSRPRREPRPATAGTVEHPERAASPRSGRAGRSRPGAGAGATRPGRAAPSCWPASPSARWRTWVSRPASRCTRRSRAWR